MCALHEDSLVSTAVGILAEALALISPYQTRHVNRFGHYAVNLDRMPEPVEYELPFPVFTPSTAGERPPR